MAHDIKTDVNNGNDLASVIGRPRLSPHAYFIVSAVFHYLGPACAVLLFGSIQPLGVAWLRIATAAIIFTVWRRPWRYVGQMDKHDCRLVVLLGGVLAAMNICFYVAISRLPLGTVGAIEFLGPVALAAIGLRSRRNVLALTLVSVGVFYLTSLRLVVEPLGYAFAFANCGLFVLYIILGHRMAARGGRAGVDRLALAMTVAMMVALPVGIGEAAPALVSPLLLVAAIGVGLASSVIPYICDQWAMAQLPRATFALFLAVLPAIAVMMGIVILQQLPSRTELIGVALVIVGIALHRPTPQT